MWGGSFVEKGGERVRTGRRGWERARQGRGCERAEEGLGEGCGGGEEAEVRRRRVGVAEEQGWREGWRGEVGVGKAREGLRRGKERRRQREGGGLRICRKGADTARPEAISTVGFLRRFLLVHNSFQAARMERGAQRCFWR